MIKYFSKQAKNDSEISISLPIKGRPVSGRPWKEDETKRSSSRIMKPPSCHPSWEEKLQERKEKESLKLKENELKEQKKEEIEVKQFILFLNNNIDLMKKNPIFRKEKN